MEKTYKSFVRNGANLNEADKEKLRKINSRLSVWSLTFGQNLLAETNAYKLVIDNEADLAGLPQGQIDAAAEDAKAAGEEGKWVFTLQNPSIMPFLQYAENRELRKQIWEAYQSRANHDNDKDNKAILVEMANLRREKAQLLGYKTHADYVLEESMAKTSEQVYNLLNQLWTPALAKAKQEKDEMQAIVVADGKDFNIEPWDWRFYEEKLRQQKFNLDEQEVKPYFALDKVQDGVFMVVKNLFGLTFEEIKGSTNPGAVVISFAAGKTISFISNCLGTNNPVIRVMPNTPTLVGKGMAATSMGAGVTDAQREFVLGFLAATGTVIEVSEDLQDAVTATSGSGPAYFFAFVEAMVSGAKELGLSDHDATTLTIQTIVGAAKLLDESGKSATTLRENVTSPNGTTAAALASFGNDNLNSMVAKAMKAARDRSQELA